MTLCYERLELTLSTVACDAIVRALEATQTVPWNFHVNAIANGELANLVNELRARLQRRDQDPKVESNWDLIS